MAFSGLVTGGTLALRSKGVNVASRTWILRQNNVRERLERRSR